MREVADWGRKHAERTAARPAAADHESVAPARLRLRRKLEHGERYRKADRRCDTLAELKLREGVDEVLRWLRTA